MTGEDTYDHHRNPKTWLIYAKLNEGDDYTVIANVVGDTKMRDENNTVYGFDFVNDANKKYKYFKFIVTAHEDGGFQLAELFMAGRDDPPIVDVDYPYAISTTGTSVKLTVDCDEEGVAYQWQRSEANEVESNVTFENIDGATSQENEFKDSDLVNGAWYRCRVGDSFSKAVQLINPNPGGSGWGSATDMYSRKWTNPHTDSKTWSTSWYVSNGTAAYALDVDGYYVKFDIVGKYVKDSKTYMLQTTYAGDGWSMTSSTEKDPGVQDKWSVKQKAPDSLKITFDESNESNVNVEATLNDGGSFAVYSDTQLGNQATSGDYYDSAALIAGLNSNKGIKQLAMIGAESEAKASNENPAFNIQGIKNDPVFWVGPYWLNVYAFNTDEYNGCTLNEVHANGREKTEAAVKAEGIDSGTAISWLNLEAEATVDFQFAVGDAASVGAISSTVDYENETLTGLDANQK